MCLGGVEQSRRGKRIAACPRLRAGKNRTVRGRTSLIAHQEG
jgi:hypothetical protein